MITILSADSQRVAILQTIHYAACSYGRYPYPGSKRVLPFTPQTSHTLFVRSLPLCTINWDKAPTGRLSIMRNGLITFTLTLSAQIKITTYHQTGSGI